MRIIIDGKKMTSRRVLHSYLEETLGFPSYYGKNLDALWDLLSTDSRELEILVINFQDLIENLGDYGENLLELLQDVCIENPKIKLEIEMI